MYNDQPNKIATTIYISYLMRLWRTAGNTEWLASLEAPGTHERHTFSDLASFFAFLQAETGTEQECEETASRKDTNTLYAEPP
jgi:hypothetical protein